MSPTGLGQTLLSTNSRSIVFSVGGCCSCCRCYITGLRHPTCSSSPALITLQSGQKITKAPRQQTFNKNYQQGVCPRGIVNAKLKFSQTAGQGTVRLKEQLTLYQPHGVHTFLQFFLLCFDFPIHLIKPYPRTFFKNAALWTLVQSFADCRSRCPRLMAGLRWKWCIHWAS